MIATLALIAGLAAQQPGSPAYHACMDRAGGVTMAMLECGKAEVGRWDRRLNAAYGVLMKRATPAARIRLRAEQRTWLAHHLREVRRRADDPNNGSLAFVDSQAFELSDISARTLVLERRVAHGG